MQFSVLLIPLLPLYAILLDILIQLPQILTPFVTKSSLLEIKWLGKHQYHYLSLLSYSL
jgi:hypothetical protein